MYPYNQSLTKHAQELRKNMTPEEKHIWYDFLKRLPVVVKRQYVVGNYILDFFIPCENIAIELDGSQHFLPNARETDKKRDAELSAIEIRVIRYSNKEINQNFEGVVVDILKTLHLTYKDLK